MVNESYICIFRNNSNDDNEWNAALLYEFQRLNTD